MNILITSSRLDGLGGTQSFVRELGAGLQKKGHSVLAFSSNPGDPATLGRRGMIPTVRHPDELPFRPDVIHGQHHLSIMAALLSLPGVPALCHCHGAVWRECPPKHPRIYHYLTVSHTAAFRLAVESNLDPARVSVLPNTVDTDRFAKVRTLPAKPVRALFYNKIHGPRSPVVTAIREAAAQAGIQLEFAGRYFGEFIADPEDTLPQYDIVFASGRSAIDALACGCAVVVLGRTSCGPLVRMENYDHLRSVNFAIAVNSPPSSARQILAELGRYSASDNAVLTRRLREEASTARGIDAITGIYQQVIDLHRDTPEDLPAERSAAAAYLRRISPLFNVADSIVSHSEEGGDPSRLISPDGFRGEG